MGFSGGSRLAGFVILITRTWSLCDRCNTPFGLHGWPSVNRVRTNAAEWVRFQDMKTSAGATGSERAEVRQQGCERERRVLIKL